MQSWKTLCTWQITKSVQHLVAVYIRDRVTEFLPLNRGKSSPTCSSPGTSHAQEAQAWLATAQTRAQQSQLLSLKCVCLSGGLQGDKLVGQRLGSFPIRKTPKCLARFVSSQEAHLFELNGVPSFQVDFFTLCPLSGLPPTGLQTPRNRAMETPKLSLSHQQTRLNSGTRSHSYS